MFVDRRLFMICICAPKTKGSLRIKKYDIPESKRDYIYKSFYKYMLDKSTRHNDKIAEEIVSRDFNIYIDRYYWKYTLKNLSEKYDRSTNRITQITEKIERNFDKFCNNIKPGTIASLNLDTRMYNWLSWTGKFDVYNDSIEKLYEYDKEFYLKKIRNFGQKSFDKLNKALVENGYSEIQ